MEIVSQLSHGASSAVTVSICAAGMQQGKVCGNVGGAGVPAGRGCETHSLLKLCWLLAQQAEVELLLPGSVAR